MAASRVRAGARTHARGVLGRRGAEAAQAGKGRRRVGLGRVERKGRGRPS